MATRRMPVTGRMHIRASVRWVFFCLLLTSRQLSVESFEPISTGVAVGASILISIGLSSYNQLVCTFGDCCESAINFNFTGLQSALTNQLHGQPLVKNTVLSLLKSHMSHAEPEKPLSLSFHGWTGSGKSFVSRLIADHVYKYESKSRFIHRFMATVHFPHHNKVAEYQDNLRQWIHGNVSLCARSMFIFDEMDKMPNGLLNAIKPYLDNYPEIDGVDYRKTIFIFLSNTAGARINARTLEHWEAGVKRELIKHKEMDELISLSSYNEDGGLWHSSLIEMNMLSAFIPFLPLERRHVKACIRDNMREKGFRINEELVDQVLDEISFFPGTKNVFSKSGCKRVAQKVDLIMEINDLDG